jgi:AcrR family transcriptional regulator
MPRPANPTLSEALRLVEQKGPSGIKVRAVASGLGCSTTAIYQHFASKDDLLLALKLQAGDLLAEGIEALAQYYSGDLAQPPAVSTASHPRPDAPHAASFGAARRGRRSPGALAACNALGVGDVLWLIS